MAEREEPRVASTEDHPRDPERRFAALYQAYYRPIMAYVVRRVASAEDAADVVADVFTTAWRRIGELPEAPADRLWLYGVAQRVIAGRRQISPAAVPSDRAAPGRRRHLATEPARTGSAQSRPARSRPAQSRPAQSRPGRTGPGRTRPGRTGPSRTGPARTPGCHLRPGSGGA
jgi:Sigma-70 region 2